MISTLSTLPAVGLEHQAVAVDFETYYDTECTIQTLGGWAYTHHPLFQAYLVTIYDGEQSYVGHPQDFDWASIEGRFLISHNRSFDYMVYMRLVEQGIVEHVPFAEWACTADMAAYLKAGRALKRACKNLLGRELSKDVRRLMKGLLPADMEQLMLIEKGKNNTLKLVPLQEGGKPFYEHVCEYALSDSVNSRDLWIDYHEQWPIEERRLSLLTGHRATKGFMIDRPKLKKDVVVLNKVRRTAKATLPWAKDLVEDEGVLSIPQLQQAIRNLGVEPPSTTSEDALELQEWEQSHPEIQLTVAMRDFRKAGILMKRCQVLLDRSNPADDRFSYAMRYCGAPRTMRWAGGSSEASGGWNDKGFNVHNFPKEPLHGVDLRNRVIAAPGKKLIIADASQIEPRCLAWCSGDEAKIARMKAGESVYQIHAVDTMGHDPLIDLKTTNKNRYALSKVRVLGLGYQCGHVKFRDFAASQYKYFMTLPESKRNVSEFRRKERKIKKLWNKLQAELEMSIGGNYEIELPSGRILTYFEVQRHGRDIIARREMDGKFMKYYGGLLTENLIQAMARDVFGFMLLNLEDEFGDVGLFDVHDETILEVDPGITAREVEEVMAIVPPWAAGLPVAAEAHESQFYLK